MFIIFPRFSIQIQAFAQIDRKYNYKRILYLSALLYLDYKDSERSCQLFLLMPIHDDYHAFLHTVVLAEEIVVIGVVFSISTH